MATYLFNTITEFQDFVGGGANASLTLHSIAPVMDNAAQQYLLPWLGDTQWNRLVEGVEADDLTVAEQDLLKYVQSPLALLTMHEYTKIGGIQVSGAGIYRIETEDNKSAFKYQENLYRDYMLMNGFEAIERMLIFLEGSVGLYPNWQSSTGYARNKMLVINYAREFRDLYSLELSRHTFETLRPIIEQVEFFAIQPLIGDDQYLDLKDKIATKSLTADDSKLLRYIQRPVVHFSIKEALRRHLVQLKGNRVLQTERLEPQSTEKQSNPTAQAFRMATHHEDEMGNRLISLLLKFLTDNIDTYPLYQTWKEAQEAAEEENTVTERCEVLIEGVYESCRHCGHSSCSCSSTKKGVVRL